jgi:two-component system cell cycle sensor histidine kinase/response regulator CckA
MTKIFVVEDEPIVSLHLQRVLNNLGYIVAGVAASGEAALETVGAAGPDLVLMDIRLNGDLDGVETAERIHAAHDLPVIFLTGYSDSQTLQRAKVTDSFGYILKPIEERALHIAIDTAVYRHATEARLRQFQKMESIGRLAAGLAHDFNNLLTVIQGHADARRWGMDGDRSREGITRAVDHASRLTRQLLTFSRQQRLELRMLDLNGLVIHMRVMLDRLLDASATIRFRPTAELPAVQGDAGMLEQVLMNLTVNARDAMTGCGKIEIRTYAVELDAAAAQGRDAPEARAGHFVCLEVSDTGVGMDEATRQRACEPFFTTKTLGQGTGLGLSTVYGIVQQHRGWLELESTPGRGTTCRVLLPAEFHHASPNALAPVNIETARAAGTRPAPTILLVEDEESLRELTTATLEDAGYAVIAAVSGLEALALWELHAGRIDLLFTDMIMPEGISGRQLAERLSKSRPGLKIIYTSGYSLDLTDPHFAGGRDIYFLEKPYRSAQLLAEVRDCLAGKPVTAQAA